MLRNSCFESRVCFLLQDTETWQFGWRPVLLVEAGEIKAFMASEGFVGDNLELVSLRIKCMQETNEPWPSKTDAAPRALSSSLQSVAVPRLAGVLQFKSEL